MLYSVISFILSALVILMGLAFLAIPIYFMYEMANDEHSMWNSLKIKKRPKGLSKKDKECIERYIYDGYKCMKR